MNFKKLGNTDLKVSTICLGTMTWGEQNSQKDAFEQMDYAVDHAINFFDTAELYAVPMKPETRGKTSQIIGEWFSKSKKRNKIILADKVAGRSPMTWLRPKNEETCLNKKQIDFAINRSLKDLKTDYIDLLQVHRYYPEYHIEETLGALTDLIRQGKVRYAGCSTFPPYILMKAIMLSEMKQFIRFAVEESPYNLLDRRIENELVPLALEHGIGIFAWSPLAHGMLVGFLRSTTCVIIQTNWDRPPQSPAI